MTIPNVSNSRETYTTAELQAEFTVDGFAMGYVVVTRKADGVRGSMMFKRVNDDGGNAHRVYYGWVEDK